MMKVLPLAGFSAVVSPWMTPSFTLHSRGSPSQPVRSLPLKSDCAPLGSGGVVRGASAASTVRANDDAVNKSNERIMILSPEKTSGWKFQSRFGSGDYV